MGRMRFAFLFSAVVAEWSLPSCRTNWSIIDNDVDTMCGPYSVGQTCDAYGTGYDYKCSYDACCDGNTMHTNTDGETGCKFIVHGCAMSIRRSLLDDDEDFDDLDDLDLEESSGRAVF